MKKTIIIVVIIIIAFFGYRYFKGSPDTAVPVDQGSTIDDTTSQASTTQNSVDNSPISIIGKSVQGRDITAYNYGTGAKNLLFVGGIHGGYSWNTASVAYELMKYLETNPSIVPSNIKVTVIPVLNPDGLNSAVGTTSSNFMKSDVSKSEAKVIASRFNANNVDLNRNFDCDWKESGKWQNKTVSGGTNPFSEPETQAIKSYIEKNKPVAVVIWYSSAGGVYASNCHSGVLPETKTIGMAYADASGYKYDESFDFYATTGDMANWLAKVNTPGISILLTNHTDIEWNKNKAGVEALLEYYSK